MMLDNDRDKKRRLLRGYLASEEYRRAGTVPGQLWKQIIRHCYDAGDYDQSLTAWALVQLRADGREAEIAGYLLRILSHSTDSEGRTPLDAAHQEPRPRDSG